MYDANTTTNNTVSPIGGTAEYTANEVEIEINVVGQAVNLEVIGSING
jgi:hypothetical protein